MKTVILAGGYGKRLRPLTDRKPKPLIRVSGIPILLWQLHWLNGYGVDEAVICVGHLKEKIFDYIGDGARFGVHTEYSVEKTPLGTGGALKNAREMLEGEKRFLMLNGDILTDLDPSELWRRVDAGAEASISVVPLPSPYGVVEIDRDDTIHGFTEKPLVEGYWINAGIYCLTPNVIQYLPDKGNIEDTAFPEMAGRGVIKAVKYRNNVWRSIDSPKDMEKSAQELRRELNRVAKKFHITDRESDSV